MKRVLQSFILFSALFIFCKENVTSPEYKDISFSISNHILAGYFVNAITFDSKGNAWIGTFKQGLIKFDGNTTVYNSSNSAMPDSAVIWDVEKDQNDTIWIGTDVGLIRYDQKEFHIYNTSNSPLAEDVVWSIAVDQNNVLWIASCRFRQGGLMRFDGENWTLYSPENSALPSNSVRDVVVDHMNNKWIAMNETLNNGCIIKITENNWEVYDKEDIGLSPYYFGNITIDKEYNSYISIDYSLSSLFDMTRPNIIKYNGKNWTVHNPVDENGESLGYVGKIRTDLYGNLWALLHGRENINLAVFNGQHWNYNQVELPLSWGSEIAVDESNTVWIGTGNGIYLINQ